jgi:hypothetical protein
VTPTEPEEAVSTELVPLTKRPTSTSLPVPEVPLLPERLVPTDSTCRGIGPVLLVTLMALPTATQNTRRERRMPTRRVPVELAGS